MLETLITRPHFCFFMIGAIARQQSQGPFKLVSTTVSQSSSLSSSIGPRMLTPALLTRMSIRPNVSMTCATMASTEARLVTSAASREGLATLGLGDDLGRSLRAFRLAGRERDIRSGRGERIGDHPPQPPRTTGHQGHLAIEPKSVQNIAAHIGYSPIGLLVVACSDRVRLSELG